MSGASPSSTATTFRAASTPIAVRVSTVADPRWGMSTTFSRSSRSGCTSGSRSKTSSPAPAIGPGAQGRGERRLVDDRPSRRIDEKRRRLHPLQRGGVDQVVRLSAERAVERHDISSPQQLLEREEARLELRLDRTLRPPPARICDLHAERPRPACRRLADLAEPDDPERLALDAGPEHEEHAPRPRGLRPDEPFALAQAPRRHQDERERQVGCRLCQNAGRVRHHDAAPGARRDVDVVVPHRGIRDDAKPRAGGIQEARRPPGRGAASPRRRRRPPPRAAPPARAAGRGARPRRLPPL